MSVAALLADRAENRRRAALERLWVPASARAQSSAPPNLFTLITVLGISERERELLRTMVRLSEATQQFEIAADEDTLNDPRWPTDVRKPTRGEVRSLVGAD
jgi:hypothetical protein